MLAGIGLALARVPRWAWIAGAAAVLTLLLVWRVHAAGVETGKRSRDSEVATLTADLQTVRRNVRDLQAGIAEQNAAVSALADARAAALKTGREAEKRAARAREDTAALRARLDAASLAGGQPGAAVSQLNREAWEHLQ